MRIIYSFLLLFLFNVSFAEPIKFDYYYHGDLLGDEHVSVALPKSPEIMEMNGVSVYVAKDEEGTEFSITAIQVPHADYDLNESIKLLIKSIEKSNTKELVSATNETIVWSQNNKITQLTVIQSDYFIYFLTTTGSILNEEKAKTFVDSFAVTAEFTLA